MFKLKALVAVLFLICLFLVETAAPAMSMSLPKGSSLKNLQSPANVSSSSAGKSFASAISSLGLLQAGTVDFSISFAARNGGQLNSFIADSKAPKNGGRRTLTERQFEADYSPAQSSYNQAIAYLLAYNLMVTQTWPNRLLLSGEGSVSNVEKAFGTQIGLFSYENTTFYKSLAAIAVPSALGSCGIAGVNVDSFPVTPGANVASGQVAADSSPNALVDGEPADFRSLYGTSEAIQNGANGTGTVIAIVDAYGDPTINDDVAKFDNFYGLPNINLTVNSTRGSDSHWARETALDVEWAHAMAPGANITLQLAPSDADGDMYDAVDSLVSSPNPPNVISLSWSGTETTDFSYIFAAAVAKGIEVYASSGDNGAYNGTGSSVSYPASDPNVVAVGGTEVYYNTVQGVNQYYEYGWSGSGGGYSTLFQEPLYQKNAEIPDPNGTRAVPDVSLDASGNSPVMIYDGGYQQSVYGTSVAAPMMAGIASVALNEGYNLTDNALYSLYNPSDPARYDLAFHDIYLSGNNGYSVQPGWDAVTGLGSINFQNFADIFSQSTGLSLTAQSLTPSSVSAGQSFSLTYTINNPNSTGSLTQIGLGANIRLDGSTAEINDSSNDIYVNLQGGSNTQSRNFATSASLAPGSYDVNWQVWMGQPGLGNLLYSSGWQTNQLQVNGPLTVSVTPASWTMDVGQSVTFTAAASGGTGSLSYQWCSGSTVISGQTGTSYAFTASSTASPDVYCNVTDSSSPPVTVQSNTPAITVNPALNAPIVSASASSIDPGQSSTLSVSRDISGGTSTFLYQWYAAALGGGFSPVGSPSSSATTYVFSPSVSTSAGAYQFELQVADSASSPDTAVSNVVTVTVNPALSVSVSPSTWTMDVGQSKSFTANPTGGSGNYTSYQWYVNGTASTMPFTPASAGNYTLTVAVTDSLGLTSAQSTSRLVTVNSALVAPSASPTLGTLTQGQTSSLTSTAVTSGTPTYMYQWFSEAPGTSSYTLISGASSSSYNFVTSTSTSAGTWSFILQVTDNTGAAVNSTAATVTVDVPSSTPAPTSTATPLASPSPTPAPTQTPLPSPTPTQEPTVTSTATVTDNSATADQSSTTGVNVTVKGPSLQDGTQLNITTTDLGDTQPAGTATVSVDGAVFYDVEVSSSSGSLGSDISVTVAMSNPGFTRASVIEYWNGETWVSVATTFTAPDTVSGTVPASALTASIFSVGTPKQNPTTSTPTAFLLIAISIVVAAIVIVSVTLIYVKKRPHAYVVIS
ncbi:MAG: protease pro-enzyme activation domain-containing protein [Candidatus Bathyarchaeia archaeon]|jgi:subtilase family serine protease